MMKVSDWNSFGWSEEGKSGSAQQRGVGRATLQQWRCMII